MNLFTVAAITLSRPAPMFKAFQVQVWDCDLSDPPFELPKIITERSVGALILNRPYLTIALVEILTVQILSLSLNFSLQCQH